MQETGTLFRALELGALDKTLVRLYGADRLEENKIRYAAVIAGYTKTFGSPPQALFSAPGRT
ncbi:MAG: galactokinase, partial [Oscillospiraceae bacterium]